ncbi:hypothetical protein Fmac_008642 [Flemingia macrophylla]|uniref:AIPP2-like SPOC-like domain-containing protein n=1 Tax=Flemingia macrophylla TaxID=520843 RepID=A0ABD1MY01_9FABA
MVEPCDICGDHGFLETIVTCSKCHVNREHCYCMRVNTLLIPEYWLCEPCQSKCASDSPNKANQNIGPRTSKMQQPVKTGKVKFLHEDEVIRLSSGKASVESKNVSKIPSLTTKPNPPVSSAKLIGNLPRNDEIQKSMTNQHASFLLTKGSQKKCIGENQLPMGVVVHDKNVQDHDLQKQKPTKRASFEALSARKYAPSVSSGPPKECIRENQQPMGGVLEKKVQTHNLQKEKPTKWAPFKALSSRKLFASVGSGGILDAECIWSNTEKIDLKSSQEQEKVNIHRNFLPSSILAWKGQFQIPQTASSCEFHDGFEVQAQSPCIVSRKAYNFSKKMPSVLQLETLSALNVLTDVFRDESPKLQDIALFFFPLEDNERSRKNLSSILKFMNANKSLMRSYIGGVELLVFTSNQLDMDSRGVIAAVNAGHFLWGIFRQNKIDKAMVPIDMDIDMIGGNNVVGRVDNVVGRVPHMESDDMDIDMSGGKDMPGRIDQIRSSKPRVYNKLDVPPG